MHLTQPVLALPANFHITQGNIDYSEIVTENFRVYFDSRVPGEGLIMARSLEAIRPLIEKWFEIQRPPQAPLRVVSSPITQHASFANFIYDALELQTSGQNIRDLAWHEYTHAMTYEHYRNFLSPPGSIFHLLWMPAWFLEGIAEALSVSIGSDYQSGVERWHALTGNWPSYDRLHSLYLNPTWSSRGYATSGAFVSWIIRELHLRYPEKQYALADMLRYFRKQTLPWMLPLNLFQPARKMLSDYLHEEGPSLYNTYQIRAEAYWKAASSGTFLTQSKSPRVKIHSKQYWGVASDPSGSYALVFGSGDHKQYLPMNFNDEGWLQSYGPPAPSRNYLDGPGVSHATSVSSLNFTAKIEIRDTQGKTQRRSIRISPLNPPGVENPGGGGLEKTKQDSSSSPLSHTLFEGYNIYHLFEGSKHLAWLERSLEHGLRLCNIQKRALSPLLSSSVSHSPKITTQSERTPTYRYRGVKCHDLGKAAFMSQVIGIRYQYTSPDLTSSLKGSMSNNIPSTSEVWIRIEESTLSGDRYRILVWKDSIGQVKRQPWHPLAKPINVAFTGKHQTWVLTSDRTRTYLTEITPKSSCRVTIQLDDFILGAWGSPSGTLVLKLFEGFSESLIRVRPRDMKKYHCSVPEPHSSPLLEGMRILAAKNQSSRSNFVTSDQMPSLEEVIQRTHSWKIRYHGKSMASQRLEEAEDSNEGGLRAQKYTEEESAKNVQNFYQHYRELTGKVLSHKQRHKALLKTPNLNTNSQIQGVAVSSSEIKEQQLRWSTPVFFPWLGANDNIAQVGLITIPLIDDLQNHQVRGTVLVGLDSAYPAIQMTYTNFQGYQPWSLDIYKKRTYNGFLAEYRKAFYYDENGGHISTSKRYSLLTDLSLYYSLGANISWLNPQNLHHVKGISNEPRGLRNEPYLRLYLTQKIPYLRTAITLGATMIVAPEVLNSDRYDYYKSRLSVEYRQRLFSVSELRLGVDYGQTRGKKMLLLKELYSSMSSFIPGSGAPSDKFHLPVFGSGNLFRIYFGDTYLRNSAILTTPLYRDLDTLIWIFYAERLVWNVITYYGKAWYDLLGETISDDPPFLWAYATTLDLHLENKGVQFYLGAGIGKLHEPPGSADNLFDAYVNFGFSSIF